MVNNDFRHVPCGIQYSGRHALESGAPGWRGKSTGREVYKIVWISYLRCDGAAPKRELNYQLELIDRYEAQGWMVSETSAFLPIESQFDSCAYHLRRFGDV
jgi:hypothetical protein